jgi:hypothetical protein
MLPHATAQPAAIHAHTIAYLSLTSRHITIDQGSYYPQVSGFLQVQTGVVSVPGSSQPLPATFSNHPNLSVPISFCTTTFLHLHTFTTLSSHATSRHLSSQNIFPSLTFWCYRAFQHPRGRAAARRLAYNRPRTNRDNPPPSPLTDLSKLVVNRFPERLSLHSNRPRLASHIDAMLRLFNAPAAVLGLLAIAHVPSTLAKPYPVHVEEFREVHNASQVIDKRQCAGVLCGWAQQLCCPSGTQCYTDANNQAQCGAGTGGGGTWQVYTTTYVETVGLLTKTSVYSSYIGGAVATATCKDSQSPCGGKCCDSGFYCSTNNVCAAIGGGSSGGILPTVAPPGTLAPSAPLRPTSSGLVIVTYTGRPTATVPFQTPVPTGAQGSPEPVAGGGGGLSGGAIAGIVIGVILGILLLLLLCLFCCARALFDTVLAIFGIGKKNKHTHEETYIEEHRHSAGGAAATGGRWYGQGRPARPSRVGSEKKSGVAKGAGVAAALGGLALMLGLKRHQDKKHDDKSTTVSGSSYYYSDYTSSSKSSNLSYTT